MVANNPNDQDNGSLRLESMESSFFNELDPNDTDEKGDRKSLSLYR
mgnify:CR=1 FL=1